MLPDMDPYDLDEAGKKRWKRLLPDTWRRRGMQTDIAEELRKTCPTKGDSYANWMSNFGNGNRTGLLAILGHDKRAQVVARKLGLRDAGELHDLLEQARTTARHAGLFEVLVPGFEEFGPVPVDELYVPLTSGSRSSLPGSDRLSGLRLDVHPILADIVCRHPLEAFRFAVLGPPGSGRTTWLKHLAWSLSLAEMQVFPWRPGQVAPPRGPSRLVAFCDDTSSWAAEEWNRLTSWLESTSGVALVASSQATLPPGPRHFHEASLGQKPSDNPVVRAEPEWSEDAVGWIRRPLDRTTVEDRLMKLKGVCRDKWGRELDHALLLEWFDRNPYAGTLLDEPMAFYHMARMVFDGAKPDPAALLDGHAKLCAARIAETSRATALFLGQLGGRLATRLAERAVEPTASDTAALAIEVVDEARLRPKGAAWQVADILELQDGLVASGFLCRSRSDEARLTFSFRLQRVAAQAQWLRQGADSLAEDRAAVLITSNDGVDALLLQATSEGRLDNVIAWIRQLPADLLAQSGPALARLLALGAPCRDRNLAIWAFRYAATWALAWGAPGYPWRQPGHPPPNREDEMRAAGQQVVGLLGRASCIHRRVLADSDLTPLGRAEAPELHEFAVLMGRQSTSEARLRALLALATCGVTPWLDSGLWLQLTDKKESSEDRLVAHHTFTDWWALAGGEYFEALGHAAETLLAGTGEMVLPPERLDFDRPRGLIAAAVGRRLVAGDTNAAGRFAVWLLHALEWGSTQQRKHLRDAWDGATAGQHTAIADMVAAKLGEGLPAAWVRFPDSGVEDWFRALRDDRVWALRMVLGPTRCEVVIRSWCATAGPHLPWSEVLDAYPEAGPLVVDWVERAAQDGDRAFHSPLVDEVASAASADPDGWRRGQPCDPKRAMAWLCRFGTVETLRHVIDRFGFRSPLSWAGTAARSELARRDRGLLRLHRLERGVRMTDGLSDIHPLLGERVLWEELLRAEPEGPRRFVRAVQVAVASGEAEAEIWEAALALFPSTGVEPAVDQQADDEQWDEKKRQFPFVELGETLFYGAEWAPRRVESVVRAILCSPIAAAIVSEPLMSAAQRTLGPGAVIEWIDRLLAEHPEYSAAHLMRWTIRGWDGVEAMRLALARPRLRMAAASAVAANILPERGDVVVGLLDAALGSAPRRSKGGSDEALALLLEAAARRAPRESIAWLDANPHAATPDVWRTLVPQLPPGPHRARALREALGSPTTKRRSSR